MSGGQTIHHTHQMGGYQSSLDSNNRPCQIRYCQKCGSAEYVGADGTATDPSLYRKCSDWMRMG